MKMMWGKGFLGLATLAMMTTVAAAQTAAPAKELSDKSVNVLMEYAWTILPAKFTTPDNKVIEVDKKTKKKETMVPPAVGREVIKVGYISAQAQLCEMWEDQVNNFDAMMRLQRSKNGWTEQQMLYITTLHRMTIHMAAGKLKVTGPEDNLVVTLEAIEPSKDTCNDEKRKKVKEVVAAQIEAAKAVPAPKKAAAPEAAPAAVQAVVPASQKK